MAKIKDLTTILPQHLEPKDRVVLIAPSFQATNEQIQQAHVQLESLQLIVENHITENVNDGYFAMPKEKALEQIHQAFLDRHIKALFGLRGGYGCARLLPYLDWDLIQSNPKIVLGFSDFTALLNAIYQKTGLITFHGPTGSIEWAETTKKYLESLLFAQQPVTFNSEDTKNETIILSPGIARGKLIGGNLSVLSSLVGTNFLPQDWQDKILFLEDVNEEVYRIDRMLTHLKLANILTQVKGIILGRFNQCTQKVLHSFSLLEIFQRMIQDLHIPVIYNTMFGHQSLMFTLPIGAEVELDAHRKNFRLRCPAVC